KMRRHSVDVVPLVLLRKTPNEGPDAESYTTMSPARAAWRRAIGYMLEAPVSVRPRKATWHANARMLLRRCAPLDTNLQLRVPPCGVAASPILGVPGPSCTCVQRPRPRP